MEGRVIAFFSLAEAMLAAHRIENETGAPAYVIDEHAPALVPNPIDGFRVLVFSAGAEGEGGPGLERCDAVPGTDDSAGASGDQFADGSDDEFEEPWREPDVFWLPESFMRFVWAALSVFVLITALTFLFAAPYVLLDLLVFAILTCIMAPFLALAGFVGWFFGDTRAQQTPGREQMRRLVMVVAGLVLGFLR